MGAELARFLGVMSAAFGLTVAVFVLGDAPLVAFVTLAVAAPVVTALARSRVEAARRRRQGGPRRSS